MTTTDQHATVRRVDDVSNRDGKAPRRTHIDWSAAKTFYVSLEPHERSYGAVSRRFGVSDVSVGKHARAEGWADAAAEADNKVAANDVERAVRTREQRRRKVLGLIDATLDGFDDQLSEKLRDARLSDIPALVKLAELLEGEATDRVETTRLLPLISGFVVRIGAIVPRELSAELDQAVDWFEGELRALEPGERAA